MQPPPGDVDTSESEHRVPEKTTEFERRLLRLAVDCAPICLFVLDGRGTVLVSAGAERRAFAGESQIVGRSIAECLENVPEAQGAAARALTGEAANWAGLIGDRWHELSLSPVFDSDGGLVVVAGVAVDRTAHVQAQLSRRADASRLERVLDGALLALARAVELREPCTAGHQRRVAGLADAIARELGWKVSRLANLRTAALLHDIGRQACPAEVLNRPGPLTSAEMTLVKTHSRVGAAMLVEMELEGPVVEAVLQHHERIDGSGYPDGLVRTRILPEARVIAVADVVEAMTSPRPFRPAHAMRAAMTEIVAARGRLFDEDAVDACERVLAGGFTFEGRLA